MYHGYVPGIILLQVIRDGIPLLVSTIPLRTGTAMSVLFCTCLFSSIETLTCFVPRARNQGNRLMWENHHRHHHHHQPAKLRSLWIKFKKEKEKEASPQGARKSRRQKILLEMTLMITVATVSYCRCLITQSHLIHVARTTSSVRHYPSGSIADLVGITF